MRRCRVCGLSKPLDQFGVERHGRDGRNYTCRPCQSARALARSRANPARAYGAHLLRRYGITFARYEEMLELQGGVCAVCRGLGKARDRAGNPKRLEVHHNHRTGQVIALLCWECNAGMGKLRDDPELLRRAARLQEGALDWMSSTD